MQKCGICGKEINPDKVATQGNALFNLMHGLIGEPGICESCWINHEFREPNWDDPKDMGGE